MRIVGGKFKGRKLEAPEGLDTRPTSDRARESIFNILEHQSWGRGALRAKRTLDMFAGTGALGLEAFSRGSTHVTFIDNNEVAMKFLHKNAKPFKAERNQLSMIRCDATNLAPARETFDLVFVDAPYKSGMTDTSLQSLWAKGWMKTGTVCVVEVSKTDEWQPGAQFEELDQRKYGAAKVFFLRVK